MQALKNNPMKRGTVLVLTAICLVFICGFAVLAIDLGYVTLVRVQLQKVADASALAGVSGLIDPNGFIGQSNDMELAYEATSRAMEYA